MPPRLTAATIAGLLWACATPTPAQEAPTTLRSRIAAGVDIVHGKLTYYSSRLAGRKTASGEPFDPEDLTMAHRTLPFGTLVRVTNPANARSVVVRVNDRGPSSPHRVGDVSPAAARELKMMAAGVVDARLEVVAAAD